MSTDSMKDSIHAMLGSEKISFLQRCTLKAKKVEDRVLAVTEFRLIWMTAPKIKIAIESNLLDIAGIKAVSDTELHFNLKKPGLIAIEFAQTSHLVGCVTAICSEFKRCFPATKKLPFNLEIPSKFKEPIPDREAACGGFVASFRLLSNFLGFPVHEEICWDVEHIIAAQKLTTLNLNEFEQLSVNDVKVLMTTLRYNSYFHGLEANDYPIGKDKAAMDAVIEMIKHNPALDFINFTNVSAKTEFFAEFFGAVASNKKLNLRVVNMSRNPLEGPGALALAKVIEQSSVGFTELILADCGLEKKSGSALGIAMKKNAKLSQTLVTLNLAHNKIDNEGSSSIAAFLANPNVVQVLNLSDTNSNLEVIAGAILRGCPELKKINLSLNKFSPKMIASLQSWITSSSNLKEFFINETGVSPDGLKGIITAINSNVYLQDVSLNASNNALGLLGAQLIVECVPKWNGITALDVSNNGFEDEGISLIADAFCDNTVLTDLRIGANVSQKHIKKSGNFTTAFSSLINLFESDCPLSALDISGSKTSQPKLDDILSLIYAIGVNESVASLDVSNNNLGNKGAMALGKAIQTNKSLETLYWDENGTQLAGFQAFLVGMKRNTSIKSMPLPLIDIANCMKDTTGDQVRIIVGKIQHCLYLNQNPAEKKRQAMFEPIADYAHQANIDTLVGRLKREDNGVMCKGEENAKVVADAENVATLISEFTQIRDDAKIELEGTLKRVITEFASTLRATVEAIKQNTRTKYLASMGQLKSISEEEIKRFGIAIDIGATELDEQKLTQILVSKTSAEVNQIAADCLQSQAEIVAECVFEKMNDSLANLYTESRSKKKHGKKDTEASPESDSFIEKPPSRVPPSASRARGAAETPQAQPDLNAMLARGPPTRAPPTRAPPRSVPKLGNSVLSKATKPNEIGPALDAPTKSRPRVATAVKGKGGRRPPTRAARPTRKDDTSKDLL